MSQNKNDLSAFFEPCAVAAVGSMREGIGNAYSLIKNMREFGFSGDIYPINPNPNKNGDVFGLKVYKDVCKVEGKIDLAVLLTPPPVTPEVVEQCARKGVKAVIVLSEGFAESGEEGAALQSQLTEITHRTGIRIMGPNTFGTVNTAISLATIAPFLGAGEMNKGGVAVCSQTGSTGPHQVALADLGYPISKMCDIGNKCDVNETDILNYLADDPETKVVAMHLEDVKDGPRFMEAAKKLTARKPLVVLKTGRTEAGARASASHTGSLMGSDGVYNAALRQVGAIRANSWQEFWEIPKTLVHQPLPSGNRFAIVTITGGQGVIAADAAEDAGLEIAEFSPATIDKLKKMSPRLGGNPVDIGPAMSDSRSQSSSNPFHAFQKSLSLVLADPNADCMTASFCVSQLLEPLIPMAVEIVQKLLRKTRKTVNIWVYGTSLPIIEDLTRRLNAGGIPAYTDLEMAVKSLGWAAYYSKVRSAMSM